MNRLKSLLLPLLLVAPLALWQTNSAAQDSPAEFSQGQLDAMLAPIALYPDTLLSHILIAATYPLEVIQADRWVKANPGLEGEDAVNAVDGEDWDPSVKALVAFPRLLAQMSEDLDWVQQLGDAFLLDEAGVVASIQNLRRRAHDAGNLKSNDYVEVHHEPESIVIEPAVRHVVYVPYYDTRVVYGDWWWPTYRPVYWAYPAHYYSHSGFYWSSGIHVHSGFFFSSFYWPSHRVVVVHRHHHRFYSGRAVARYHGASHWRHNPYHRRGVGYRHEQVSRHYNANRPSWESRQQHRSGGVMREAVNQRNQHSGGTANQRNQRSGGAMREAVNQRQQHDNQQRTNTYSPPPSAEGVRERLRQEPTSDSTERRDQRNVRSNREGGVLREAIGNRQDSQSTIQRENRARERSTAPTLREPENRNQRQENIRQHQPAQRQVQPVQRQEQPAQRQVQPQRESRPQNSRRETRSLDSSQQRSNTRESWNQRRDSGSANQRNNQQNQSRRER